VKEVRMKDKLNQQINFCTHIWRLLLDHWG